MSDTPRTDGYVKTLIDNNRGAESLEHFARQLERELNASKADAESWREQAERFGQQLIDRNEQLNAANERIKQLERDMYAAIEKIKRLESWNTQHCHDKNNLIETLRYRDGQIKELEGQLSCMTGT